MHIKGDRLSRKFGRQEALHDATFECHPGEIIALIGNNGAGKTTLLQLLAGFLVPTQGRIQMDGQEVDRSDENFRRRIGIIPDFPPFFMEHSVIQHIAMVCALHHITEEGLENKVLNLMDEIGILALGNSKMNTLSRGEIYKTVLVGTLLVQPELWLIDEPMASGMDPQGLTFLRTRLREETRNGAIVIYSTQIAEIAERFSDRIFVLQDGKIVLQESVPSLVSRLGTTSLEEALLKTFSA